jgi:hypothetical protein
MKYSPFFATLLCSLFAAYADSQTPSASPGPMFVDLRTSSGDLARACADAIAKDAVLFIHDTVAPSGSLTCAADLYIGPHAMIAPTGAAKVTFSSSHIDAPLRKWIDMSAGTVLLDGLSEIYSDWFGADRTGKTDSTQAINWATYSASLSGTLNTTIGENASPKVRLASGVYRTGNPPGGSTQFNSPSVLVGGPGPQHFVDGLTLEGVNGASTFISYSGPPDAYAVLVDGSGGGVKDVSIQMAKEGTGWEAAVGVIDNGGAVPSESTWYPVYPKSGPVPPNTWMWKRSTGNAFDHVSINCGNKPGNGFQFGGFNPYQASGQADQSFVQSSGGSYCPWGVIFLQAGNNATADVLSNVGVGRSHIGVWAGQSEPMMVRGREFDNMDVNFYTAAATQLTVRDVQSQNSAREFMQLGSPAPSVAVFDGLTVNGQGLRFISGKACGSICLPAEGAVNVTSATTSPMPKPVFHYPWETQFLFAPGSYPESQLLELCTPHLLIEGDRIVLYDSKTDRFFGFGVTYVDGRPHTTSRCGQGTFDNAQWVWTGTSQNVETADGLAVNLTGNCTASMSVSAPQTSTDAIEFSQLCLAPGTPFVVPGAGAGGADLATKIVSCSTATSCTISPPASTGVSKVTPRPPNGTYFQAQFGFASPNGSYSVVNSWFNHETNVVSDNVGHETWMNDFWGDMTPDPTNHGIFTCNNTILNNKYSTPHGIVDMPDCAGANVAK